jgi:hypothetical protein
MNVKWVDISPILTKEPEFADIYEYEFVWGS